MKLVAIVGPTACGKTSRGVALARKIHAEIVSADSRQVYRGMDIGTGKDLGDYGTDVPYHLIDVVPAGYKYNLYEYLRDARAAIDDISSRNKTPLIVGGTGLYVESLLKGIIMPEVPENPDLRNELADKSLEELTRMLAEMKSLHNTTDVDTVKRAIRAIEIEQYYHEHPEEGNAAKNPTPVPATIIGIDIPRDIRRNLISERLQRRFEQENMLDEVRSLLKCGLSPDDLIYYGLEYKYLTLHLTGELSFNRMKDELETAIHQFAKRQMTWFRGMERRGFRINWLPFDLGMEDFLAEAQKIIDRENA